MTCILGDVRSGRCSVFQGVGTSLQGALPVCRSLTFPKQKRFQINPPTDLLSNFHINNKTTLVFCLRVRTTCGFWLPRYDHHLLNPQSLRQEGKWGVRCQDFEFSNCAQFCYCPMGPDLSTSVDKDNLGNLNHFVFVP